MISFMISVVPPKIETISLNPGRANDSSAQIASRALSLPLRGPSARAMLGPARDFCHQ
jgi:hypothetical protein